MDKFNETNFLEYLEKGISANTKYLDDLRIVSKLHKEAMINLKDSYGSDKLKIFEDIEIRHGLHTLLTISILDLLSILKLFKNSSLLWEKVFLIKHCYLTIYETIKAYEKKKQKIRQLVIDNNCDIETLDLINKTIKVFKNKFEYENIKNIRNNVAGHIDDNFDLYYDTIIEIEPQDGLNAVQSLLDILVNLNEYLEYLRITLNNILNKNEAEMKIEIENIKNKIREKINKFKK